MRAPIDRRDFLKGSATLGAGLVALGNSSAAEPGEDDKPSNRQAGPNDTVRLAVIGVRGRGREHVQGFTRLNDVKITTICDVDPSVIGPAMRAVAKRNGSEPKFVQDLRKVLEDKTIDAVSIATPNHWHSLATIWACQAGKDVYVEKPVSHNIFEGRKAVEAARKYDRIVQCGTQCRSNKGIQDAVEFLRSGGLGTVYLARGLCYKRRDSIGHQPDGPVPKGVDYSLWLGPAPERPFNPNRFHYNWHWFWDTGNGDLGNQGIHQMDIARWGLGKKEFPKSVTASGGRFGYADDGQTPNTLTVAFDYDDAMLEFEVRGLPTNAEAGAKIGVLFYGTKGVLAITSYTDWQTYLGHEGAKGPGGKGGGDHFANFIAGVKSRDRKTLHADIEEGHISSAYCHLGNIAYRLGRKLHINPTSESFVNDREADALLTREYRAPFVVPARV